MKMLIFATALACVVGSASADEFTCVAISKGGSAINISQIGLSLESLQIQGQFVEPVASGHSIDHDFYYQKWRTKSFENLQRSYTLLINSGTIYSIAETARGVEATREYMTKHGAICPALKIAVDKNVRRVASEKKAKEEEETKAKHAAELNELGKW